MKRTHEPVMWISLLIGIFFLLGADAAVGTSASAQSQPRVEIYTTTWCTACKQAVAYLRTKGVAFTEYDVEKDAAAGRRWQALSPNGGVPVAVIGDQIIRGFSREAYDKALNPQR
jgi:glutaredoxin-like YruB-family protein